MNPPKRTILLGIASCALLLGLAAATGRSAPPTPAAVTLSASGTVEAPQQLALAFSGSGRLIEVDARQGERVAAGTVLARLDPAPALAGLQTATAALASARAQLLQVRQGLSRAERLQLGVGLRQSQQALAAADQSITDAKASAAQDATRLQTAVDQANAQSTADGAKLSSDEAALGNDQRTADSTAAQVSGDRSQLASDEAGLLAAQKQQADDEAASAPAATLAADAKAVLNAQAAVAADESQLSDDGSNAADTRNALSSDQAQIAADQTAVTADRNAATVAQNAQAAGAAAERQSLDTARAAVDSARLGVSTARAENAVRAEAPRVGTLAAARAAVRVAEATLATAEQTLRETRLVAPFTGTVAAVAAVAGQLVPVQGDGLITLVNLNELTVTADFDAAEAALLAPGQPATITVPALADRALAGRVVAIDPLPDQAADYTAAIALGDPLQALRPGMQVTVDVRATADLRGR